MIPPWYTLIVSHVKNVLLLKARPLVSARCWVFIHLSELLVQFWIQQREVLTDIAVQDQGEHWRHGVYCSISDLQPTLVERDSFEVSIKLLVIMTYARNRR